LHTRTEEDRRKMSLRYLGHSVESWMWSFWSRLDTRDAVLRVRWGKGATAHRGEKVGWFQHLKPSHVTPHSAQWLRRFPNTEHTTSFSIQHNSSLPWTYWHAPRKEQRENFHCAGTPQYGEDRFDLETRIDWCWKQRQDNSCSEPKRGKLYKYVRTIFMRTWSLRACRPITSVLSNTQALKV